MPLPNDPQQRKKIAAAVVRLGKMPPDQRKEHLQRIKEVRQDSKAKPSQQSAKAKPTTPASPPATSR